ncbi:hypothetical protein Tco_0425227 [Tanacetum coccineum]
MGLRIQSFKQEFIYDIKSIMNIIVQNISLWNKILGLLELKWVEMGFSVMDSIDEYDDVFEGVDLKGMGVGLFYWLKTPWCLSFLGAGHVVWMATAERKQGSDGGACKLLGCLLGDVIEVLEVVEVLELASVVEFALSFQWFHGLFLVLRILPMMWILGTNLIFALLWRRGVLLLMLTNKGWVDGNGSNPSGGFGKPGGGREKRRGGDGLEGPGG